MAFGDLYIVNFEEAIALFQHRVARDDIPTIDTDQVKWRVMEMFHHVGPLNQLLLIADDMVRTDYLYSKIDFSDVTFDESFANKQQLDAYLRDCIVELGRNMHGKLSEAGMLYRRTELYEIAGPIDNETYTLRQIGG